MLAEALEIKRLPVDQKLRSLHLYGTETEFFRIAVLSVMNFRLVQVRSAGIRLPEMDLRDPKLSLSGRWLPPLQLLSASMIFKVTGAPTVCTI